MKKVDSSVFMDRHDTASAVSRDDGKKAFLCKKDSRHCGGTPKEVENVFFNHAQRRKDFEARIGALQGECGDKPSGLSHKRAAAIHDSSPKANAQTKQRRLNGIND